MYYNKIALHSEGLFYYNTNELGIMCSYQKFLQCYIFVVSSAKKWIIPMYYIYCFYCISVYCIDYYVFNPFFFEIQILFTCIHVKKIESVIPM